VLVKALDRHDPREAAVAEDLAEMHGPHAARADDVVQSVAADALHAEMVARASCLSARARRAYFLVP
jgi:hypothetical protein